MQGMLRIVGTLAVLGVALIGILVALGLITGIAAQDILVKTAWVLAIIAVASLLLSLLTTSKKE